MTVNEKIAMVKALANDSELTDEIVTLLIFLKMMKGRKSPSKFPKSMR